MYLVFLYFDSAVNLYGYVVVILQQVIFYLLFKQFKSLMKAGDGELEILRL